MKLAEQPWTRASEMVLRASDVDGAIPDDLRDSRFRYFLELSIIDEFILDLRQAGLSESEQLDAIIHYAEYDAFPAWFYSRSNTSS